MKPTLTLLTALLLAPLDVLHAADVTNLRCEYLNNPLGIDIAKPRLGWEIEAQGSRGIRQAAYQILVASSEDILKKHTGDLWDSGKVASDQSIQIVYGGKPLVSRKSYFWKVKVGTISHLNSAKSAWSKPASFEMGLLKPDSWKAQWIALDGLEGKQASPLLRKEVDVTGKIKRRGCICPGWAGASFTSMVRKSRRMCSRLD